jgi:hypothetical protein
VQVAKNVSQCMPGPGESRDELADVFAALQARTIRLMSGGAAEMAVLEDSPPRCVESDVCAASALSGIICRTEASRFAIIEHCYQEALAIIQANKSVLIALARR